MRVRGARSFAAPRLPPVGMKLGGSGHPLQGGLVMERETPLVLGLRRGSQGSGGGNFQNGGPKGD